MAMIQGIDGSALIQAFRAGRNDRYANEDRLRAQQKEEAERQRGEQFRGLVGQLFGGQQAPSVASNYAPEPQPQSFGEAFTPEGIAGAGPEAPMNAPPPMPAEAPRRTANPDVLAQLIILDPETGTKIASALKTMDEMKLAQFEKRNNFMGAAAQYIQQGRTPEERLQRFQIATPALIDAGFTPEELDGIDNDLSDERLQFYTATALDYDKFIDNELAERESNRPKIITPQPGEGAFAYNPDTGEVDTIIQPNPGGMPAGAPVSDIPPQAVEALRRGEGTPEQFDEIFGEGAAARVMGGGGGDATGNFPGGQ